MSESTRCPTCKAVWQVVDGPHRGMASILVREREDEDEACDDPWHILPAAPAVAAPEGAVRANPYTLDSLRDLSSATLLDIGNDIETIISHRHPNSAAPVASGDGPTPHLDYALTRFERLVQEGATSEALAAAGCELASHLRASRAAASGGPKLDDVDEQDERQGDPLAELRAKVARAAQAGFAWDRFDIVTMEALLARIEIRT